MDKHTQRKVFQIAFQAAILEQKIKELVPQHPDDIESELVVCWSEIEEILEEFNEKTQTAFRGGE